MEKENRDKSLRTLFTVLFIIEIFGIIILGILFSKSMKSEFIMEMIIPVITLVGHIPGFENKMKKETFDPKMLFVPIIGIIVLGIIYDANFGNGMTYSISIKDIAYVVLAFLAIVGTVMIVYGSRKLLRRNRCNMPILAECTGVKRKNGRVCNVYRIYHDGQAMEICNNEYGRPSDTRIGDEKEIMINPDKPTEYFVPEEMSSSAIIIVGIGIAIVLVMIFALVMMGSK